MSGKNISRRNFLKGSAASALVLSSTFMINGCSNQEQQADQKVESDSQSIAWDMAADFIVVGGGTGLSGAVSAAVKGMSVILLEKRKAVGGAMALSGGVAWFPNTKYSQEKGDSYDKSLTYLKHMQMDQPNEEIMYAFLDNTQNTLDTLEEGGFLLSPLPYAMEYHSDWEGAQNEGGRSTVVRGEDGSMSTVGGGARMNDALVKSCNNLGVKILYGTSGRKLITSRNDSDSVPVVLGIIAANDDGKEYRIKANRGVLLATGGFEWDDLLVSHYVRVPNRYAVSYPANNGDALRMVQAVGADLRMMNEFWGQSVYTKHGEFSKKHGTPCAIACQTERAVPGTILVDNNGRRFCNEASDYDSQGNTMGGYNNYFDNGWTCDPAWLIYDDTCYQTYGVVGHGQDSGFPVPDIPEDEMVIKADTLLELAGKIGINGEQLEKTVDEFNFYARQGKDPLFHRGETFTPLSQVRETLAPLEKEPYRAISVSSGCLGTKGGPRLNKNAQVIHVEGEPIIGLYAMGNCAGVGAPGPTYGGAGGTIGPAFVIGYIAAQHAASRTDVKDKDFFTVDTSVSSDIQLADNEYLGTGSGISGPVKVKVTVEDGKMTNIEVVEHNETIGIGDNAINQLPNIIINKQSTDVDVISGATITSKAIFAAVEDAMKQAGLK